MPKYDVVFIVSELVSGENMVRKRRNGDALQRVDAWFTAFWFQKVAKTYSVSGICNVEIGKILCIFGKNVVQCSRFHVLFK